MKNHSCIFKKKSGVNCTFLSFLPEKNLMTGFTCSIWTGSLVVQKSHVREFEYHQVSRFSYETLLNHHSFFILFLTTTECLAIGWWTIMIVKYFWICWAINLEQCWTSHIIICVQTKCLLFSVCYKKLQNVYFFEINNFKT